MAKRKKGIVLAVDLGTETTVVAYKTKDGHVEVIPDPDGLLCTPTVVGFEGGDPKVPLFGRAARSYRKMSPEYTCSFGKRARGRGKAAGIIDGDGKPWSTEELEARFLAWRLEAARDRVGETIAGVLITVPAAFNDAQRRATQEVVEKAGYPCIGTVNEPTAALLGYGKDKIGVFGVADVGGGTFDVNVIGVERGNTFTTLATAGQDDLGGREFTLRLVEECVRHAASEGVPIDVIENLRDMVGIEMACEEAKKELSGQTSTLITFRAGDRLLECEITRDKFEALTADLSERILACMVEGLSQSGMQAADLEGVVFAGGASRVPSVRRGIEELVGPDKILRDIDPDMAVAMGACEAVGLRLEERRKAGDAALVDGVAPYLLKGDVSLKEVTGQSLGVAALKNGTGTPVLAVIVEHGKPLPAVEKRRFGLSNGDADEVNATITVLEGKAYAPEEDCHILAAIPLSGLPAGPTDDRIEITFEIDTNGLVDVHAVDTHSGKELRHRVDAGSAVAKTSTG